MKNIGITARKLLALPLAAWMLAACGRGATEPLARQSPIQNTASESAPVQSASGTTDIAKDYPHSFCPIYEPSTILESKQINVEDKVNYIIELVSKDELSEIEAFYLELDNISSNLSHGGVLSQIHLERKSDKHAGIINIVTVDNSDYASYESKGYKTSISIMVDIGW